MIQPRLPLSLADKLDAFLAHARLHGLRVKALRLSPAEFETLHSDPDALKYIDGKYADVRIRIAYRPVNVPSPWLTLHERMGQLLRETTQQMVEQRRNTRSAQHVREFGVDRRG